MLSSNTLKKSGGIRERGGEKQVASEIACVVFLVYPYPDIVYVECTTDDKYLVLWHCSNHPSHKKMGSERHKEQRRGVSLKACTFGSGGG